MVLPLCRLNTVGYDNKPHNAREDYYYTQAFPEESSLQRGGIVPFYRGPVLQRGYGIGSIFKSVARSVMPSLKEIGKSALTTGSEVLQDVAKGKNIKTAAKKRLKENSLAFLDDTVSRSFFESRSFLTSSYSIEFSKRQVYRLSSNHITLRWWTNRV